MSKEKIELKPIEKELSVCVAVQHQGEATYKEIDEKLQEGNVKLTLTEIKRYCKKLQKKGVFSLNYRQENGTIEDAFSLQKTIFSRGIQLAHLKDFIKTPESEELKKMLEDLENSPGVNKGRKPDWADYYNVEIELKVKDGILGFWNFKDPDFMQHYKIGNQYVLKPSHFRAWVRGNQRLINQTSLHNYVGFDYGYINLNGSPVDVISNSILDGKQGKGIRKWERIPGGATIKTKMRVPGKINPKDFQEFIKNTGEFPLHGLTGKSSMNDYGRFELKSFKVIT